MIRFAATRKAPPGAGDAPIKLAEYRFPVLAGVPSELIEDEKRPPVWITAVGGDAFWPVAVIPQDAGRVPAGRFPGEQILTSWMGGWPFAAMPPAPLPSLLIASPAPPARPGLADLYMHFDDPVHAEEGKLQGLPAEGKLQIPPVDVLKGLSVLYLLFSAFVSLYSLLCILECAGMLVASRAGVFFAHLGVLRPRSPRTGAPAQAELARRREFRERGALLVALALFATFFVMMLWLGTYSAAPRVFREQLAQALPRWSSASGEFDLFQPARECLGATAAAGSALAVLSLALRLGRVGVRLGFRGCLLMAGSWAVLAIALRSATLAVVPWAFGTGAPAANAQSSAAAGISGVFSHWRAIHPASFLSPITPMIALVVILLLAFAATLRLLALDETLDREPLLGWRPDLPAHPLLNPTALCCGVIVGEPRSTSANGGNRRGIVYGGALVLAAIPATWVFATVRTSLDPGAVELTIRVSLAIAVMLCFLLMVHMFVLWAELRRWLGAVADSPLRATLAEARDRITAHVRKGSRMRAPDEPALGLLRQRFAAATGVSSATSGSTGDGAAKGAKELEQLEQLGRALASFALDPKQSQALRDFVGLRAAYQIAFAVFRLRSIWLRVAIASTCFVSAIACYPLYPHKELLVLCWGLVAAMAGVTIGIFVEMNRNEVLSILSGTDPNVVSWNADFVQRLVVFGGLPVLSLLAAQFPEVARALLAVVEPVFRGIH